MPHTCTYAHACHIRPDPSLTEPHPYAGGCLVTCHTQLFCWNAIIRQVCDVTLVSRSQTLTPREEGEGDSLVKHYTSSCPSASYGGATNQIASLWYYIVCGGVSDYEQTKIPLRTRVYSPFTMNTSNYVFTDVFSCFWPCVNFLQQEHWASLHKKVQLRYSIILYIYIIIQNALCADNS